MVLQKYSAGCGDLWGHASHLEVLLQMNPLWPPSLSFSSVNDFPSCFDISPGCQQSSSLCSRKKPLSLLFLALFLGHICNAQGLTPIFTPGGLRGSYEIESTSSYHYCCLLCCSCLYRSPVGPNLYWGSLTSGFSCPTTVGLSNTVPDHHLTPFHCWFKHLSEGKRDRVRV